MTKKEFEERAGVVVSVNDYRIIEQVYTYHPAISEAGGKHEIATLYETGGMPLIKSMVEAAKIMEELERERDQGMARLEKINNRIKNVKNGCLAYEQCRKDADDLFAKVNNPAEWELAKAFLISKYGVSIAERVTEEVGA